jgi:hypothetical protein
MPSAAQFSYRQAIEEHCFLQRPLLDADQFVRAAADRGLPRLDGAALEGLDVEGLLPPVAYRLGGFSGFGTEAALLAEGRLLLREDTEFRPWGDIQDEYGAKAAGSFLPLYSCWQLLTFSELWKQLRPEPAAPFLRAGLDASLADRREAAGWVDREGLFASAAVGARRDLLLVRTQTILVPRITGTYIAQDVPDIGDSAEWTFALEETFDWEAAARECEVDADALADGYRTLALQGQFIDPLWAWWLLVDQARHRVRAKLRDDALMARDFYDAARVLRGWHSQLSTEPLPDIDELADPEQARAAKKRLYGDADVRHNRAALVPLLDSYGLYPWRVQLVVEGPSEENLLGELLKLVYGHTLASLGVLVVKLKGAGVPKRTDELLDAVREYANTYFLVFDNEGNIAKLVTQLEKRGLIDSQTDVYQWKSDLEADNFSLDELCDVVQEHIRTKDNLPEFAVDRDEVRQRLADQEGKADKKGVMSVIHDVVDGQFARFDKDDVAIELARHAHSHPQLPDGHDRPVYQLLADIVMAAEADRRLPAPDEPPEAEEPTAPGLDGADSD